MTTKELTIAEGNKLIAEFMGAKPYYLDSNVLTYPMMENPEQSLNNTTTHHASKLKYHSSWDWLMPVVEKVSRIKCIWDNVTPEEQDTYYPRTFGMLNSETKRPMVRLNSCPLFEADTLIEATWLAITDFIQWYNNSKQIV